jgi:hypothetical protein
MSAKKSQSPLRLIINESKSLQQLMICLHALALIASIMNGLVISLKIVLLLIIACHYYLYNKRRTKPPYSLEYTETGWQLVNHDEVLTLQILPSTVISTIAIFLHFKADNQANDAHVIFCDALADDDYRKLIVMLKTTFSKD